MLRRFVVVKWGQMRAAKTTGLWVVPLIVTLALTAGTTTLAGQGINATSSLTSAAGDSSWPQVDLNVVVSDKHGVPQKIDEQEFRLFENGAERQLQFRGSPDSPVSLALLVDSSGSVFKSKDAIITAVKAIVNGLPEGSEVTAVLFADEAFLDLPFTPASKVDFSFLDRLQAHGGTTLYDAMVATEEHVIQHAKLRGEPWSF